MFRVLGRCGGGLAQSVSQGNKVCKSGKQNLEVRETKSVGQGNEMCNWRPPVRLSGGHEL